MQDPSKLIFFFLFSISFDPAFLYAQNDNESNAYYLDDNNISSSKNVIKIDGMALVHGELPFIFERVLTRRLSIEAGLGILLPYYVHDFLPLIFNRDPGFSNHSIGNSIWLKTKLYNDRAPDLHYIDFTLRRRNFSNATLTDISFGLGRQLIVGTRLTIDTGIGVGLRFQKSWDGEIAFDEDNDMALIIPLQFKVGYLF